jgi:hypothetical protein
MVSIKEKIWDNPGVHNSIKTLINAAFKAWNSISVEDLTLQMQKQVDVMIATKGPGWHTSI